MKEKKKLFDLNVNLIFFCYICNNLLIDYFFKLNRLAVLLVDKNRFSFNYMLITSDKKIYDDYIYIHIDNNQH